jgi:signal transduction histidine kinase/DNA-binding response OmpR family regulator
VRKHPIPRQRPGRTRLGRGPGFPVVGLAALAAVGAFAALEARAALRVPPVLLPYGRPIGAIVAAVLAVEVLRALTSWLIGRDAAHRAAPAPGAAFLEAGGGRAGEADENLLMDLLADLGLALVLTDRAGAIRAANAAATRLLAPDGKLPQAVLDPRGLFFGLPVEDGERLAALVQFFTRDDTAARGEVTIAASRRRVSWTGRVLTGREGFGAGRLFLMRDVTEERRFEALKSDFLGTVSHELRTPLTALRGSLELVLARAEGLAATDRELVGIGVKNTERLIRLINDLLDVDRLEQGTISFQFATIDVRELVASAVAATAGAFAERNVRVETALGDDLPTVHGDRERLKQVLVNLLDNARKFSPSDATVSVRAEACDGGVEVEVADQGHGIPAAELPHVFERFWQADHSSPEAGAGLGLPICRAIVARHEGRIWIDSEPGKGTTVSLFLPRSIFRAEPEAGDPPTAASPPAGARILLVEDDPDAAAVMRASLEQCGHEVVLAPTGGHAVRLARRERPAAVLLDLVLPDISGYDVLRILKNSPDTAAIPVVVLSIEPERELARRLGAWDALQKPIDFEAVRWSLVGALRSVGRKDGRLVLGVGPTVSRDLAVLAGSLEEDAHEVYRAHDLDDLARWSADHYPDLLVLDRDFLTQSCAEAAERLRTIAIGRPIPLVFLASGGSSDADGGSWVSLAKPICKRDVLEIAESLLDGRTS